MKKENSTWSSVNRILRLAGRYKTWLFAAIGVDLVQTATTIFFSHCLRRTFEAVSAGDHTLFWYWTWLTLVTAGAGIPLSYLRTRWIGTFSERTMAVLRRKIAAQSTVLPVSYLEERHSGDFLSVLNADLNKLKTLTSSDLLQVVSQSARALGALIYLISVSWQLTLVTTLFIPVMFLLVSLMTQPIAKRSNELQEKLGNVNSTAQDGLSGLMVTKAFNLVQIMDKRFQQSNRQVLQNGISIARLKAIIDGIGMLVSVTPFLITFGFGGFLVINGSMTFGSLLAFINLMNFVVNPLSSLPGIFASISEASGAAQRLLHILDQKGERSDGANLKPADEPRVPAGEPCVPAGEPCVPAGEPCVPAGEIIRFNNVSFAYTEGTPVLENVSFDIHTGKTVAVVGPSGGGKTTLLKLLLGFYPVEQDRITLLGHDLNAWHLPAARQQMAFVAQDTYLFPVSIAENIACGKPGASQEEIEAAAQAANIHDFILTLPEGYKTPVGERGARLSGGQRQRISLARAILKNAPILLLDEATSALDSESEALVQEALERFMLNRTAVVIAHRLSTIKNADHVLVLDKGKIVEQGTHENLLAKGGLYQDLYLRQFADETAPAGAGVKHAVGSENQEVIHGS